jgi:menaquinol-cytochrome c reductase iron-sulfur subunit
MSTDESTNQTDPAEPSDQPPAPADEAAPTDPSRRRLMIATVGACGGLIAAAVGVPALGMFVGPMLQEQPEAWRAVGPVDQFKVGETVQVNFESVSPVPWSGVTAETAAWLRRETETEFIAFAVNCTHLGCPVRWEATADLFMCPCHGGTYYGDGSVAAGPPPRALNRYQTRVTNGQVEVQASALPIR